MTTLQTRLRGLAAGLALSLLAGHAAAAATQEGRDRGPHVRPFPVFVIEAAGVALAELPADGVSAVARARDVVRRAAEQSYALRARHRASEATAAYLDRQDAVLARFWRKLGQALTHADYTALRRAVWADTGAPARFDPSYLAPEGVRARPELDAARARAVGALLAAGDEMAGMFFATDRAMQDFVDDRTAAALAILNTPLTEAERDRIGLAAPADAPGEP